MVLVRNVFRVKWGMVGEVLEPFKATLQRGADMFGGRARVMTDLTGPFHTIVLEFEVASLAQWEKDRGTMFADPDMQAAMARTNVHMDSGWSEFYTIEAEA